MAYTSSTNLALRTIVEEKRIHEDMANLLSAISTNNGLLETYLSGFATIATNPSIVNTGGAQIVQLYACSAGSISTITGMKKGVPFTLVMMSSGASKALLDDDTNHLRALVNNWIPNTIYSTLTLVWNGSKLIEIGRTTAA